MKLSNNMANKKSIRELAKGEFFKLTDSETASVWVRSEYDRSSRNFHGWL